jgi:hypothetical protein
MSRGVGVALLAVLSAALSNREACAQSVSMPDFFLFGNQCMSLGADATKVKQVRSDVINFACYRSSGSVRCLGTPDDPEVAKKETSPVVVQFGEVVETQGVMFLSSKGGGDFISVRTGENAFVSTTRMLLPEGPILVKLCNGMYLTRAEAEHLKKAQAAKR